MLLPGWALGCRLHKWAPARGPNQPIPTCQWIWSTWEGMVFTAHSNLIETQSNPSQPASGSGPLGWVWFSNPFKSTRNLPNPSQQIWSTWSLVKYGFPTHPYLPETFLTHPDLPTDLVHQVKCGFQPFQTPSLTHQIWSTWSSMVGLERTVQGDLPNSQANIHTTFLLTIYKWIYALRNTPKICKIWSRPHEELPSIQRGPYFGLETKYPHIGAIFLDRPRFCISARILASTSATCLLAGGQNGESWVITRRWGM